jgi:AraC-like DNA-binding protein
LQIVKFQPEDENPYGNVMTPVCRQNAWGGKNMNLELSRTLPRLANINPYRTDDLDAAREHISSLFVPHRLDVIGRHQVLDVCISRAQIEGVSLVYHRHGAHVSVRPQLLRDFFLLQIPIRGEAFVTVDKHKVHCSPKQAVMISPTLGVDMTFGEGCEQLIVRIERTDLEHHVEQQLGRRIEAPVEFAPAVPLTTTAAQEITSLLRFMTVTLTEAGGICSSAIARKHMASLLISGLTSCLDHNYREEMFEGVVSRPRPAFISKAQEFIRSNIGEVIGPQDIAEAVDVSTRTLFAGFKTYLNTTPMRYLKDLRLDMVRATLSSMESRNASVTTIAMNYGFLHLGHFCAAYKRRFGELPRDTLCH